MVNDPYTLVVALDEGGKAEGDLYLDDGHSFAFTKGEYLHRRCGREGGKEGRAGSQEGRQEA